MKIYLIVILFVFFVISALIVWYCFYVRYRFYKDMVYVCKFLRNNISFNKRKFPDLFQEIVKKISPSSKYILNNHEKKLIFFKKEDFNIATEFIASIGKGDVDFELNNLSYYTDNFEELSKTSKEQLDKNGMMYFKLIIGIGLAVCIILI